MFDALVNGIQSIIDFFSMIIDFVITMFTDIGKMAVALGETITKLPTYLGFLPSSIIAVFLTIFGIVVVYKILGREG